ncbi:hypothetical protein SAMN05421854_107288 [Amycolatopsis rubida]|uniref:Uncharacterized protein n=1 Tax=Amycolatopsis rubida TaxID=112413 RepID=A0A1I5TXJ8_9PSEU|nr:hypothetical protein SAMN05421854_107288 [Amycolatopsis rubida]
MPGSHSARAEGDRLGVPDRPGARADSHQERDSPPGDQRRGAASARVSACVAPLRAIIVTTTAVATVPAMMRCRGGGPGSGSTGCRTVSIRVSRRGEVASAASSRASASKRSAGSFSSWRVVSSVRGRGLVEEARGHRRFRGVPGERGDAFDGVVECRAKREQVTAPLPHHDPRRPVLGHDVRVVAEPGGVPRRPLGPLEPAGSFGLAGRRRQPQLLHRDVHAGGFVPSPPHAAETAGPEFADQVVTAADRRVRSPSAMPTVLVRSRSSVAPA